jgi:hypothetical protein
MAAGVGVHLRIDDRRTAVLGGIERTRPRTEKLGLFDLAVGIATQLRQD